MSASAEVLGSRIGHRFADESLLAHALRHSSYASEHPGAPSNERLEFLGDAVLGWAVTDALFRRHPELDEGELSSLRKAVVNADALAEVAESIDLGAHLQLGRGEEAAGGRERSSILADALEALVAAVFLDAGADAAHGVVTELLAPLLDDASAAVARLDAKSRLIEWATQHERIVTFDVRGHGPDHEKRFDAIAFLDGTESGRGTGRTKKEAERLAALDALHTLEPEATA